MQATAVLIILVPKTMPENLRVNSAFNRFLWYFIEQDGVAAVPQLL
jgi:hypothetical protein